MVALGIPARRGENAGGRVVDGDNDPGRRGLVARRIISGAAVNDFEEGYGIEAATAFDNIVAAATKQRIGTRIIEYVLCREVLGGIRSDPLITYR